MTFMYCILLLTIILFWIKSEYDRSDLRKEIRKLKESQETVLFRELSFISNTNKLKFTEVYEQILKLQKKIVYKSGDMVRYQIKPNAFEKGILKTSSIKSIDIYSIDSVYYNLEDGSRHLHKDLTLVQICKKSKKC